MNDCRGAGRFLRCALAAALSVAGVAVAAPAPHVEWRGAFPPRALTDALPQLLTTVVVVPAGQKPAEAMPAARALEQALRATGAVRLVMSAEALGPVDSLDDAAIAKRCRVLPVEASAIVRVFPGERPESPIAVISFYGKDGAALTALTASLDRPLVAAEKGAVPGDGVSHATSAAVDAVLRHGRNSSVELTAKEQYDGSFLVVAKGPDDKPLGWNQLYKGQERQWISEGELYETVGRGDLSAARRRRQSARITLFAVGGTIGGLSLLGGLTALLVGAASASIDEGAGRGASSLRAGGIVLGAGVGAGLVMITTGLLISTHPISLRGADRLATEHNRLLGRRLGLPGQADEAAAAPGPQSIRLSPYLTPSGGGLVVMGLF